MNSTTEVDESTSARTARDVMAQVDDVLAFVEQRRRRDWRPVLLALVGFLVAAAALAYLVVPVLREGLGDEPTTVSDIAETQAPSVNSARRHH